MAIPIMERSTMHSTALPPQNAVIRLYAGFARLVDKLQPVVALALRCYAAKVFFTSGLTPRPSPSVR